MGGGIAPALGAFSGGVIFAVESLALFGKSCGDSEGTIGGADSANFSKDGGTCDSGNFGGLTTTGGRFEIAGGGVGTDGSAEIDFPGEEILLGFCILDKAAICRGLAELRGNDSASCLALHPHQQVAPMARIKKNFLEKRCFRMESSEIHIINHRIESRFSQKTRKDTRSAFYQQTSYLPQISQTSSESISWKPENSESM